MMIFTTRFSRKKAAFVVILLGALLSALILLIGKLPEPAPDTPQLTTNEERIAYLQSLGWEVSPEPLETLQFLLPAHLAEPYVTYNELQKTQGFDLSSYCGKQLSRYTYQVTNYPNRPEGVQLNLYICEDAPVAGDILCPGNDGFQHALEYPESESNKSPESCT